MNHRKRIAVGMSGGVDSSVTAALLKKEGYDVVGITMAIFDGAPLGKRTGRHACYGPDEKEDIDLAGAICNRLGIPFYVIDLKKEYREHVIDYFRREYCAGRTPNPCIVCNRHIKFGFLLQKAMEAGINFDIFATGHYAQIVGAGEHHFLGKAIDRAKDQSYFLYALTPAQLARTIFPLGSMTKMEVRELARKMGLKNADRHESQDFVGEEHYSILFGNEDACEGDIVDEEGNLLGKHRGIINYTIGQRRGLGISSNVPLYVTRIESEHNRLVVGEWHCLFSKGLIASDVNLTAMEKTDFPLRAKVKIRVRHKEADATIYAQDGNRVKILFDEPQMSVTPGQSAVFYADDMVLGGGVIERAIRNGGAIGTQ